jgi:hypothetical protein
VNLIRVPSAHDPAPQPAQLALPGRPGPRQRRRRHEGPLGLRPPLRPAVRLQKDQRGAEALGAVFGLQRLRLTLATAGVFFPGGSTPLLNTFPSSGTFTYQCRIDDHMTGTIVVKPPGDETDWGEREQRLLLGQLPQPAPLGAPGGPDARSAALSWIACSRPTASRVAGGRGGPRRYCPGRSVSASLIAAPSARARRVAPNPEA